MNEQIIKTYLRNIFIYKVIFITCFYSLICYGTLRRWTRVCREVIYRYDEAVCLSKYSVRKSRHPSSHIACCHLAKSVAGMTRGAQGLEQTSSVRKLTIQMLHRHLRIVTSNQMFGYVNFLSQ